MATEGQPTGQKENYTRLQVPLLIEFKLFKLEYYTVLNSIRFVHPICHLTFPCGLELLQPCLFFNILKFRNQASRLRPQCELQVVIYNLNQLVVADIFYRLYKFIEILEIFHINVLVR